MTVRRECERGVILVQFGLLAVAILAVGALTVDLGLAFLVQVRQQSAVDAASIEGLGFRDLEGDLGRRVRAREMLRRHFDPGGDPNWRSGDGPRLTLANGSEDLNAHADLVFDPNDPVETPALELNQENIVHGDLVAGDYLQGVNDHREFRDYLRSDFVAAPDADRAAVASGFLARTRRAAGELDRVPGVSSAGTPVPFLFGMGSAIQETEDYDPRRDGLTVRAAAISETRRALVASGVPGEIELLGFGFVSGFADRGWEALDLPVILEIGVDGALTDSEGRVWGQFLGGGDAEGRVADRVGEEVIRTLPVVPSAATGILPVYQSVGGADRIIGFGLVTIESVFEVGGEPFFRVVKRRAMVFPRGVSARSRAALIDLAMSPELGVAHAGFSEPVSAPVLTR